MIGTGCACNATLRNTKGSSCPNLMDIMKRFVIWPEFGEDGSKNEFATTASLTWATLEPLLNSGTDNQDRLYPVEVIENVEDVRAETVYFTFASGKKAKVKDGVRSVVAFIPFQGPEYLSKLQSWSCAKFGILPIDKADDLIYITDRTTELKVQPILVDENSWDVQLVKKTDTDPLMIRIAFDFRDTQSDALLRMVEAADLDFSPLEDFYGLYDVESTESAISQTGFTLTLLTDYGKPVTGLVAADFFDSVGGTASRLYNVTDSAAVTITSCTETAPGVYAFVFASQTVSDVIRITPVKNRYDFAEVIANTVTISA